MHIPFQFENKGKLVLGIMHIADYQLQVPIVLVMCYGLNGNRVVQHRISVKLGELLESKRINLVRFDYRNAGVSEGIFEQSNFQDRIEDIVETCKYIKACFYDKPIKLILIGFSDGARNALYVTEEIKINGLILWNPIFNIAQTRKINNNLNKNKFVLHPLYKTPLIKLQGVGLNLKMIRQIESENAVVLLEKYRNNVLLLFGDNDEITKKLRLNLVNTGIADNISYGIIKNADHLFNSSTYVDEVFKSTIEWVISNYWEG